MYFKITLPFLCAFLCLLRPVHAQKPAETKTGADTGKIVNILHADRLGFSKKDTANVIQYGAGNVAAQQEKTLFYADSAVLAQKTKIFQAYKNVHINDADSTHIYSDYLRYHFDTKQANLQKNVRLTDGKSTLTTENLDYDLGTKVGTYTTGGKVVNGSSVLTSKEGVYYGDQKDVLFRKNVMLNDPKYNLYADSLLYNTTTEIATFIGPTRIIDSNRREIITSEGFYDMKNRIAQFGKRPTIKDGRTLLKADNIYADDASGKRRAEGHAVYIDSAEGISILANLLVDDRKTNLLLATKKPLLIIKQDRDSIYVSADTILSGQLRGDTANRNPGYTTGKRILTKNGNDTSNRYMEAFHHVRIFSDSLQAVSDSLYYSGRDSIFRLFYDPIIWANKSQVTGDTIYLYTKNKKADRLNVFENGLVINKSGPELYNQVKGNVINGYFRDGNIEHIRARGNAESIYYIKDEDSAYVGVNRSTSDIIDMRFRDKELNKVVYVNDVKGTTIPFRKANHSEMRLRGFRWLDEKRPKSKFELLAQ